MGSVALRLRNTSSRGGEKEKPTSPECGREKLDPSWFKKKSFELRVEEKEEKTDHCSPGKAPLGTARKKIAKGKEEEQVRNWQM